MVSGVLKALCDRLYLCRAGVCRGVWWCNIFGLGDGVVLRACIDCNVSLEREHKNRKRCKLHAARRRKRPASKLSACQKKQVRRLVGTMYRKDIAKKVGISKSALNRYLAEEGMSSNALKYPKKDVDRVCAYYIKHGKAKTQKRFPSINVRSIVERYLKNVFPHQKPWEASELTKLLKMAGLISFKAQTAHLARTQGKPLSIRNVWARKFRCSPYSINSISLRHVKMYLKPNFIYFEKNAGSVVFKRILWIDLFRALKPETPIVIKKIVKTLHDFQLNLHGRCFRSKITAMPEAPVFYRGSKDMTKALNTSEERQNFDTRKVVATLENLMVDVTKDVVTAQTVTAACSCADKITDILKLHLDVEKFRVQTAHLSSLQSND